MPLANILSFDGPLLAMALVQDRVLRLRLVCREVLVALESSPVLKIHIYVNDTGAGRPTADFLQRWRGCVFLHCSRPWKQESIWFKEVRNALISERLRPLSLLSLSVEGNNLHPLVEALVAIRPAIRQLDITYSGHDTDLLAAAAPIASLGCNLDMNISVHFDRGGGPTPMLLQHLLASSTTIKSISFRSVRVVSTSATSLPRHFRTITPPRHGGAAQAPPDCATCKPARTR